MDHSQLMITSDVAEVLGVLLGDGCVFQYDKDHGQINGVAFTGHSSELGYYENFVKPVIEVFFAVHGRLNLRKDNTTRYRIYSKSLVLTLVALGIPVGKKFDAHIPKVVIQSGKVVPFIRASIMQRGQFIGGIRNGTRDMQRFTATSLIYKFG